MVATPAGGGAGGILVLLFVVGRTGSNGEEGNRARKRKGREQVVAGWVVGDGGVRCSACWRKTETQGRRKKEIRVRREWYTTILTFSTSLRTKKQKQK